MISIKEEKLHLDLVNEMMPLFEKSFKEVEWYTDKFSFDPDIDGYVNLHNNDMLCIITARKGKVLIGYNIFFIVNHLHCNALKMAMNDTLYIDSPYRQGMNAIRLIRKSEAILKKKGVHQVTYNTKSNYDFGKLFERVGYNFLEKVYEKLL